MTHFQPEYRRRAEDLVALYVRPRSALLPLLHLVQEQDGYVTEDGMVEVAALVGITPAEVRGTASFYDMFFLHPVGKYVVGVCTNVACLLNGGLELLDHAAGTLGCAVGETSEDGLFTLEETECLADCDRAPCVQVNHRFVRTTDAASFDALVAELRAGGRENEIPPHGTLVRVRRNGGLRVPAERLATERAAAAQARAAREGAKG